jgi:phosphoglycolate phosphatase
MIGDTAYDMAMAVEAGVRAIGVSWGYHAAAELMAAGAEVVVNAPGELVEILA